MCWLYKKLQEVKQDPQEVLRNTHAPFRSHQDGPNLEVYFFPHCIASIGRENAFKEVVNIDINWTVVIKCKSS